MSNAIPPKSTLDERLREFSQGLEALEQRMHAATEEASLSASQRLDIARSGCGNASRTGRPTPRHWQGGLRLLKMPRSPRSLNSSRRRQMYRLPGCDT